MCTPAACSAGGHCRTIVVVDATTQAPSSGHHHLVSRYVSDGLLVMTDPARIRHFSTPGTLMAGPAAHASLWKDEGLVLEPQYNTSEWDAAGTFTPGIVKECTGASCKFHLFFGGVANETSSYTEVRNSSFFNRRIFILY